MYVFDFLSIPTVAFYCFTNFYPWKVILNYYFLFKVTFHWFYLLSKCIVKPN